VRPAVTELDALRAENEALRDENAVLRAAVGRLDPPPVIAAAPRSPRWAGVRKAHLRDHPACAACGTATAPEVHHMVPFHCDPTLELVPSNLQTLCRPCHFLVGHLTDWASYNPAAPADAARWRGKVLNRPR
jgi:5-methylcytosine-specific restriction protein A